MIKMRWFFSFGLALFLAASVGCGEAEQKTDDGAPERDAAADDNAQPPDADAPDVDDAEDSVDIEEVDVCVPNCDGRLCGDDGCGNSCGQCATGQECEDGTCVKQCLKLNRTEFTASWKPIHGPDDPRGEFTIRKWRKTGTWLVPCAWKFASFTPSMDLKDLGNMTLPSKRRMVLAPVLSVSAFLIVVARLAVTGGCLQPREHL